MGALLNKLLKDIASKIKNFSIKKLFKMINKFINMKKEEFIKHACEQVLRFTQVKKWDDLSEELKAQLGFNMGAMALGLNLNKEDGFLILSNARNGSISMDEFHKYIRAITLSHKISVDEGKVARPF